MQYNVDPIIEHRPLQQQNKQKYESEIIIEDIVKRRQREWLMILAWTLEGIKELEGEDVLRLYGETKKNIMRKAKQRYQQTKDAKNLLSQEEIQYIENLVED